MKFVLNSVAACSSRIGSIKEIERLPGLILETPLLLLYSKGGSVPHLTHEVLQMVTKDPQPLQITVSSVAHAVEGIAAFKKGIADFIGLKEYLTYCTIHDIAIATPNGFNDNTTVSIWARTGRKQLDIDKYMDIIESFQPDMYHALCDGDTNQNSGKKRVQKSVDRTSKMLEQCLKRHENSEALKKSAVLGVIEGGYSINARETSAKEVGKSSVFGCVIDGFHNNGPDVEKLTFEEIKPFLEVTLKHVPSEKFRVVHGCWTPEMVLNMVEMGIDAFDSSYTYVVTERGGALVFHNTLDVPTREVPVSNGIEPEVSSNIKDMDLSDPQLKKKLLSADAEETVVTNGTCDNESAEKPQKSSFEKVADDKQQKTPSDRKYEISLADDKFAGDFTPLSKSCSCLTCQKHTRAYIHHLLQTRELLGSVLLQIHNLHHYMEFFKAIRAAVRSNSLDELKKNVHNGSRIT